MLCELCPVFTEKYCTEHRIEKLPGPRDWVQILQDQIKLARRRLKRGTDTEPAAMFFLYFLLLTYVILYTYFYLASLFYHLILFYYAKGCVTIAKGS